MWYFAFFQYCPTLYCESSFFHSYSRTYYLKIKVSISCDLVWFYSTEILEIKHLNDLISAVLPCSSLGILLDFSSGVLKFKSLKTVQHPFFVTRIQEVNVRCFRFHAGRSTDQPEEQRARSWAGAPDSGRAHRHEDQVPGQKRGGGRVCAGWGERLSFGFSLACPFALPRCVAILRVG